MIAGSGERDPGGRCGIALGQRTRAAILGEVGMVTRARVGVKGARRPGCALARTAIPSSRRARVPLRTAVRHIGVLSREICKGGRCQAMSKHHEFRSLPEFSKGTVEVEGRSFDAQIQLETLPDPSGGVPTHGGDVVLSEEAAWPIRKSDGPVIADIDGQRYELVIDADHTVYASRALSSLESGRRARTVTLGILSWRLIDGEPE